MTIRSEITVKGPAFAAAVSWAAKWAPSKPVVPIQGGIRIAVAGNGDLELTTFSESVTARATVRTDYLPMSTEIPNVAIVSARLIDALAGTLGRADVVLGPGPDGTVQLSQGRAVMTLPTMPEDDYPTLPGALAPIGEVGGEQFAAAVRRVAIAAGDLDVKPMALACMRLGFTSDTIEVMGATRERAAMVTLPWTIVADTAAGGAYADYFPDEATPLAATMADAAAAFAGPDAVEVGCDGSVLSLSSATRALTLRTVALEKGWPAQVMRGYAGLQHPNTVALEPATAVVPLRRAMIVRGKSGPIRMVFASGEIRLASVESREDGSVVGTAAGDDAIDAAGYDGDDAAFGFNPAYVAEALASAPGDKVDLSFGPANKAIKLTCAADPRWWHVVMPVRIS